AGIRQLKAGVLDLGASDMPLNDSDPALSAKGLLHFPTVIGGVVAIYNVPNLNRELNFTAQTLAGIMLGKITKWDDPLLIEGCRGDGKTNAVFLRLRRAGLCRSKQNYLRAGKERVWQVHQGRPCQRQCRSCLISGRNAG